MWKEYHRFSVSEKVGMEVKVNWEHFSISYVPLVSISMPGRLHCRLHTIDYLITR